MMTTTNHASLDSAGQRRVAGRYESANHRMHGSGGGQRFLKSNLTPAAP
ncbi:MAG: hypothetical protein RLZZ436_320 [Planctomycetota bacterium]|jgi:hypothetical protein